MVSLHKEPCSKSSLMPRTGTSSAQWGHHFWPLSVKLERSGSSKPTKTSQVTRAGWAKGAAAGPARAAGPKVKDEGNYGLGMDALVIALIKK